MYTSDDDGLFRSHVEDSVTLCLTRQKPCFMPFMSERKQALAREKLRELCFEDYLFYSGYEGGERKMLGLFYDVPDTGAFPIAALEFSYRKSFSLSHRDFLGTLMSLGIERDTVGDILIEDGRSVIFVEEKLSDYIITQISKVGGVGVTLQRVLPENLPEGRKTEELFYTVSSLRLDNIVAAVCRLSRENAKKLILSGDVCVNYKPLTGCDKCLKQNDALTVRGKGKFILNSVLGNTKKGRIKISVIYFR